MRRIPRIIQHLLYQSLSILPLYSPLIANAATYPNAPYSSPPSQWTAMLSKFPQHCSPFGISIFAYGWSDFKFKHACNVMAQFLDNDNDGCADDLTVVSNMRKYQAAMVMFPTESSVDESLVSNNIAWQDLYDSETELGCSGSDERENCRDAALEEIIHLISNYGISVSYPSTWGECNKGRDRQSLTQQAMDKARGGYFEQPPSSYPSGAVYHYTDRTCNYECQVAEFVYWVITSFLGGQDERANSIADEWEAPSRSLLQSKIPDMYNLMASAGNTQMILLSTNGVLPGTGSEIGATGTYFPEKQTCPGGCGLDGSGCGDLGSKSFADYPCEDGGNGGGGGGGGGGDDGGDGGDDGDCQDDQLKKVKGQKTCSWVSKQAKKRCKLENAKLFCKSTCKTCDDGDGDGGGGGDDGGSGNCEDDESATVKGRKKKCSWVAKKPSKRCRFKKAQLFCKNSCNLCDNDDGGGGGGGGGLNGEQACEGKNYGETQCNNIGCCEWDDGECWSSVGRDSCM